jgi:spore germination protein KC
MTGCWGKTELKEVGIVTAMGVDLEDDGQITMSVLMVIPLGSEVQQSTTWYGKAKGKTLMDASKNIRKYSSKKPEWYHSKLVIIGEKLARKDMYKVIDYLSRNQQIRYSNNIIVCEGRADEALSSPSDLETSLSSEISGLIENTSDYTKAYVEKLKDFLQSMDSKTLGSVCGRLTYSRDREITFSSNRETIMKLNTEKDYKFIALEGASVFKGMKLAGFLNDLETSGFLFITGKAKSGGIPAKINEDQYVFLDHEKPDSKIEINMDENKIGANIKVELDTLIVETTEELRLNDKELIKKIEEMAAKEVENRMKASVKKAKELNSDIFGIGEEIHKKYPKVWKEIKDDWHKIFKEIPIKYEVKVNIKGFNLIGDRIKQVK